VADSWYDRAARRPIRATDEDLLATTLVAQAASEPRTRTAVIALDRTHAGLFAGTSLAWSYWMDDAGLCATAGEPPDWLPAFNSYKTAEAARNIKWQALGAKSDAPPLRTLNYAADHPELSILVSRLALRQAAQFSLLSG
jgi:hypothetical protein